MAAQVYGRWPGLEPEQLYERRDLAVTTDFRDVLGELVSTTSGRRSMSVSGLFARAGARADLARSTRIIWISRGARGEYRFRAEIRISARSARDRRPARDYSVRSATSGSCFVARRAGT